ncbi:MAG: Acetyltransferase [Cytophagales bacterium]|jgi:sugar O-acyltransferase (sialic acid O-acetyltransferase NeuD family)|nr:NeuD/PglB/VioB family sugar acetyltransferase [Bacteroidota bacterium]MBS1979815.1 NeuD/PglB/VioB family sugar acetyltransferase [Bacteroidota bacterium]WHZ07101.1 MAG: Acetyltransferase [Cytophagales bacterium]
MKNPVIIFGANSIGRAAKELFEKNEVVVYGFLDDDKKLHQQEIDEAVVLGATDDGGFLKLIGKKCEAFVATDDNKLRKSLVKMLQEIRHVQPVNAIHPQATVSSKAEIGHGNFIDADARVSVGAKIGSHCMIHAKSFVGVETNVGDYVQIGAGALINAGATIEDDVFVGSGVTIVSGVTIGKGARIGAGSVVIASIKAGETVFGNPASVIKN